MQVDSISRLMQLNALQAMTGSSQSTSSDSTSPSFSALLQGMLGSSQGAPPLSVSSAAASTGQNRALGIGDLSVDPQKLAQMFQLKAMQNMFTSASADDTDGTSEDDSADDSSNILPDSTNDMSQMYNYMLETMNENTGSTDSPLTNSSIQGQATVIKDSVITANSNL